MPSTTWKKQKHHNTTHKYIDATAQMPEGEGRGDGGGGKTNSARLTRDYAAVERNVAKNMVGGRTTTTTITKTTTTTTPEHNGSRHGSTSSIRTYPPRELEPSKQQFHDYNDNYSRQQHTCSTEIPLTAFDDSSDPLPPPHHQLKLSVIDFVL